MARAGENFAANSRDVYKRQVIGLTIVRRSEPVEATSSYGQPRIIPAAASGSSQQVPDSSQKQPDVTMLLHVKGSAAPLTTAIFRTPLNFALFPDQEWHWAIIRAVSYTHLTRRWPRD